MDLTETIMYFTPQPFKQNFRMKLPAPHHKNHCEYYSLKQRPSRQYLDLKSAVNRHRAKRATSLKTTITTATAATNNNNKNTKWKRRPERTIVSDCWLWIGAQAQQSSILNIQTVRTYVCTERIYGQSEIIHKSFGPKIRNDARNRKQ